MAAHSPNADGVLVGVDIGTSSVKALAVALDGRPLAEASVEHPMHRPQPGWAENDPEDWFRGVVAAVHQLVESEEVDAAAVQGLALVSQRDPWVILDAEMRPLGPSISWTDRRTEADLVKFYERFDRKWLIDRSGVLPIPGLGLPILLWVQRSQPDVWRAARHLLAAKDYVLWRLTGLSATDISMPARSVMNDVRQDEWSPVICDAANIALELLPDVRWRPWEQVAELSAATGELLGLPAGIPIAAGGGDDPSATLGAGAIEDGDLCAGTGTSSDWRIVTSEATPDSELARGDLARHLVPDRFIFEICIESTGSSLRWFRDAFPDGDASNGDYLALVEQARTIPPGADGLVFIPFVDGCNRAPWFLQGATGSFLGIVSGHTRGHFARAILEGIAYQYPPTLELIAPGADATRPITLVGGETRSELWNQLKADVIGVPLRTTEANESATLGAAILAGQAAGLFTDAGHGVRELVRFKRTYDPDPDRHATYRELRDAHREVFEAVRQTYQYKRPGGFN